MWGCAYAPLASRSQSRIQDLEFRTRIASASSSGSCASVQPDRRKAAVSDYRSPDGLQNSMAERCTWTLTARPAAGSSSYFRWIRLNRSRLPIPTWSARAFRKLRARAGQSRGLGGLGARDQILESRVEDSGPEPQVDRSYWFGMSMFLLSGSASSPDSANPPPNPPHSAAAPAVHSVAGFGPRPWANARSAARAPARTAGNP